MKTCKCGETDLSKLVSCNKENFGVDIICCKCRKKVYHRREYIKNSEKLKARSRKYRSENKDKCNAYNNNYYKENKDKYQAAHLKRYSKDREKLIAYQKKYLSENKEKVHSAQNKRYHDNHAICIKVADKHYQEWTSHDFEIAVRKRASGSYIFTSKQAALRLGRTIPSILRVRKLNSEGTIPSNFTGKRSKYFNP